MKPLKDIGEQMFRNMYTTSFYDATWIHGDEASKDNIKNVEEVFVYTENDRRELVRRVWRRGWYSACGVSSYPSPEWNLETDKELDDYIKEQGL